MSIDRKIILMIASIVGSNILLLLTNRKPGRITKLILTNLS